MRKENFYDVLPGIIDNLLASPKLSKQPVVANWVKKVVEYNLKGGKHTRGIMTSIAYETLEKPENITEENLKLVGVLGWCLEMVQGYFCILDDIMDCSTTRRGATCWYLLPNVGMGAINDSILMSSSITEILEIYFLKTPYFNDVVRLFHECTFISSMGQHLDFMTAHHTKDDFSLFTLEHYENTIVPYKDSFFTFKFPLLLGLTLVKDVDMKEYTGMDEICQKLGYLYQIQDDYIDCFGDETITGKAGTDIQERKCTWLAVTALQLCTDSQKDLFTKHYGSKKPEDVEVIKKLYIDLKIPALYKQKEKEIYDKIISLVHALQSESLSKYFLILIDKIYKRNH